MNLAYIPQQVSFRCLLQESMGAAPGVAPRAAPAPNTNGRVMRPSMRLHKCPWRFLFFFFSLFPIWPNMDRFRPKQGPNQFDSDRNKCFKNKKQKKAKYFVKPRIGPILGLLSFTSDQGRRQKKIKCFKSDQTRRR